MVSTNTEVLPGVRDGGEVGMIAFYILIILVTVLAVYSAIGTYQNKQDIKALADVTKGIGINAENIYKILEILKRQEGR